MKKKAILFDLDGTLWDASMEICNIWNCVLATMTDTDVRLNHKTVCSLMGKTLPEIGAIIFNELPEEEQIEKTEKCIGAEPEILKNTGANLYENLEEVLAKLKEKYLLIVVSNCQDGYIQAFMQAHQLEKYFDDFESAGATGMGKAGNIRLVVERHGLTADEAIYVGDTEGDRQASEEAGVNFIFARYGFGEINREAANVVGEIDGLAELPAMVEKLL